MLNDDLENIDISGVLANQLGGFTPVIDQSTGEITGYKTSVGADTVFPFNKKELKRTVVMGHTRLYSNTTYVNVASRIDCFQTLTPNNFAFVTWNSQGGGTYSGYNGWLFLYDSTTGLLTVRIDGVRSDNTVECSVACFYVE